MNVRLHVVAASLVLALPLPLRAQANDADASIRAFVASFQSAWNARDAAALAALFRTDAEQVLGNRPTTVGRAAIESEWSAGLSSQPAGLTNTVVVERIRHMGPDVALVEATGNFSGGRTASGAPIRTSSDRALYVLQREAGGWALASFHVYEAVIEEGAVAEVRAARQRFVDAWSREDAGEAAMVYAIDGINMVPGIPDAVGRAEVQRSFEEFFADATVEAVEFTAARVDVQPFVAYESGTFVHRYATRDSAPVTQRARYVAVWRREAGGPWEMHRFLYNTLPREE